MNTIEGCEPSSAFGVYPPNELCAVDGCFQKGLPHVCPHDHRRHRHGMIHYWCEYPTHSLTFRKGWHLICDEHYEIVRGEREEWERQRR